MATRKFVPWNLLLSSVLAGLVACAPFADTGSLPKGGRYPDACAQWAYPARRCDAIVARAAATAGVDRHAATSIELLPFDRMAGLEPGQVRLGGGQVALVGFTFADRPSVTQDVWCVGVERGLACNEAAEIDVFSGVDRDVTCAGEPPAGCATLPPMPDPDAVAAAKPFRLASLDVALDHEGPYEVRLGTATLPNGYLSERALDIPDRTPESFWIDAGIRLDVRPDITGRSPVGSVYRDPFDGPEPITIFLVFDVTQLDTPSVLQVRDVVVR
jgi:hypothetical protein